MTRASLPHGTRTLQDKVQAMAKSQGLFVLAPSLQPDRRCRLRKRQVRRCSPMMILPPRAASILKSISPSRYLKCCHPTATIIALDRSPPLAALADAANPTLGCTFVGDAVDVSLRGGIFDAAISIAVLHHISTVERRLSAVAELARLLRPGGRAMIYAWSRDQGEESRWSIPFCITAHHALSPASPATSPPSRLQPTHS